jgi:Outer membrane protein beta-barrel domain
MKNQFIVTLLIVLMSGTMAMAQTKKPTTTTKKPTTTVKSSVPKTTTTKKTTTTTTTTTPVAVPPPIVEEKKTTTTTTTTTTPTETKSTTTPSTTTTTTTTQSSGPSKGKKTSEPRVKEPKPERVREPRPERVREPRPERVRTPREPNAGSGGVRFGIRAEAIQFVSFEQESGILFSPGFNAGLIVNFPISEKLSIQPEVLYSMAPVKGDISVLTGKSGDVATVTQNSILAPVTLNFNLGSGSTKFMINPGGYAGYLLSASSSQTKSGITESGSIDLTGIDKFSYGVVLGLGVKINGNFLIEARSFYDLKESNNKTILSTIGIGYMF